MPRRNSTPPMKVTPKVKVRKTRTKRPPQDAMESLGDALGIGLRRVDSDDPSLMLGPEEPKAGPLVDDDLSEFVESEEDQPLKPEGTP